MPPSRLPPSRARTLYNAADALLPPAPGAVAVDFAPGVAAVLRRRGPAEARRLRFLLWRLEWAPRLMRLGRGRGFSQLPREARAAALGARPADRDRLLGLLAEAAALPSGSQSESGA